MDADEPSLNNEDVMLIPCGHGLVFDTQQQSGPDSGEPL
jgi:hypothetical protein